MDAPQTLDPAALRALLPSLGDAGLAAATPAAQVPRGRILKLKLGFNPNSSSVGTTVVVLLWSLVASGAVVSYAAAVFAERFGRRRALANGGEPR